VAEREVVEVVLSRILREYRTRRRRKRYRAGAVLRRFVACDIRRDVEVIDASEIDDGFVTARVRTWNVLHASKGIAPEPEFDEPRRMEIDGIWEWKGPSWGGPTPDEEPGK
jgi:hypothetical protein